MWFHFHTLAGTLVVAATQAVSMVVYFCVWNHSLIYSSHSFDAFPSVKKRRCYLPFQLRLCHRWQKKSPFLGFHILSGRGNYPYSFLPLILCLLTSALMRVNQEKGLGGPNKLHSVCLRVCVTALHVGISNLCAKLNSGFLSHITIYNTPHLC